MNDELLRYFDIVCDKIAAHGSYGKNLEKAAADGEELVLNYHTHGADQAYCVSVCVRNATLSSLGLAAPLHELAHIRGIGATREECGPRMSAFAARLEQRYRLSRPPIVFLDGAPFVPS